MGPRVRGDDSAFCGCDLRMTHHLRAGIVTAIAALVADQASKLWLINVLDIAHRGAVRVTPFFDLELAWNVGISFGWLQSDSPAAQIGLMAVKVVAVIVLAVWMARSRNLLATVLVTALTASCTAPWSISPISTSKSAISGTAGTCLTLPMWPSLPG